MTTGQRMSIRRKEIGLSAEKVAEILGVSPATIYRYENGDIDKVPGARLAPIANALQTTPAYLMGWEDDEGTTDLGLSAIDIARWCNVPTAVAEAAIGKVCHGCITSEALIAIFEEIDKKRPTPVSESGPSEKDIRIAKWFRSLPPEMQKAILTLGDAPKDLSE